MIILIYMRVEFFIFEISEDMSICVSISKDTSLYIWNLKENRVFYQSNFQCLEFSTMSILKVELFEDHIK